MSPVHATPSSHGEAGGWSDRHACGLASMDASHEEFLRTAFSLRDCALEHIGFWLEAVRVHCEEHFSEEAALMEAFDYPVRDCHVAEHEAVAASVAEVGELWRLHADETTVRRLASSLIDWFAPHVQHLDSAVAAWVVKKTTGGIPIVLRRDIGPAGTPEIFLDLGVPDLALQERCSAVASDLNAGAYGQR